MSTIAQSFALFVGMINRCIFTFSDINLVALLSSLSISEALRLGDGFFLFQHDCVPGHEDRSIKTWVGEFGVEQQMEI